MTTSADDYLNKYRSTVQANAKKPNEYDDSPYRDMPTTPVDTSVSDRTLADAPDGPDGDSGKSGADFVNYYANASNSNGGSNAFIQDFYTRAKDQAEDLRVIDAAALDVGLERSIQNSYDKAQIGDTLLFGDYKNQNYNPPKWTNSEVQSTETPDWKKLYEDIISNIGN